MQLLEHSKQSLSPTKTTDQIAEKYDLSAKAVQLLHITMLPKAMRPSRTEIMARIGMPEWEYYRCLRNPRFNEARKDLIKQYFYDDVPDILLAMKHEAIAGNERAARLFLEFVTEDKLKEDRNKPFKPAAPPPDTQEIKIMINKLTQKFYGNDQPRAAEPIEGEARPIV